MNWNVIEGNWKQLKGNLKEEWGKLTDDDLKYVDGSFEKLVGKIQERYGRSREEAEKLNGVALFARRRQLPPPSDDEFYHDDLVGLDAVTREGEALGRVVALRNFGAGDILEIAPPGPSETLLFPFTKAVAVEMDFERGRIVIVPPQEIDGEESEGTS